jgi:hypothetical protein
MAETALLQRACATAAQEARALQAAIAAAEEGDALMGQGWARLPKELLGKVLEKLQEAPLAGGWAGFEGSVTVRLVSSGWRASHDALVTRLDVCWWTTAEDMWLLVRRFPAVVSMKMKGQAFSNMTDKGLSAVSGLTGLTSLDLSYCKLVTDQGLSAVSSLTGVTSLNLSWCFTVTDQGLSAVSSLTGLTSLDLRGCHSITHAGVEALCRETAAPNLHILSP